ncbi:uncharacterized protein LOC120087673 isoform X3 [Benincasa hispida]|uniref:uncharacterized protein LOC120087673 isoform X3 n=1 Tax=Benincasa hispida TaxID=102211 RepID=UPI001900B7E0|nr:uncharacterized protein LOC120087673 isoform X3 [Benincasa hispida]
MDESDGVQNQAPNLTSNGAKDSKGKSCKGCLYYSSLQKSKSKTPTCIGLSKTLDQVPNYIVGETELEASKEGRSLADFKYACVGYSVYLEKKDSSNDVQNKQAELPFCVGLEVLLDKRPAEHSQAHVHNKTEGTTGYHIIFVRLLISEISGDVWEVARFDASFR